MKRALGILAGLLLVAAAIAGDNFNVLDKLNISFSTATVTGQLAPANGGSGIANSKNLTWSNSLTLAGTDATTMTFPATSATIARTDAANTFTGVQTFNGTLATTTGFQFRVTDNTSLELIRAVGGTNNPGIFCKTVEANDRVMCTTSGSVGITDYWLGARGTDGVVKISTNGLLVSATGTNASQFRTTQTTVPTCTSNCGTSPSVAGTDTAGRVTMGASGVPASGWVVTFNGTWATAPVCSVTPALSSMVVGKLPIAVVTNTTTMTVTTNGTAPSTSDQYQYICVGVS